MNKEEFLKRLGQLLSDVSEEERNDAIAFYRSYFEDAGEGNEASILKELESPEKVAEAIKANLGITDREENVDAGTGTRETERKNPHTMDGNHSDENNSYTENTQAQEPEKDTCKDEYGERLYGTAGSARTSRKTAENGTGSSCYQNAGNYGTYVNQPAYHAPAQNTSKSKMPWIILAVLTSPIWVVVLVVIAAILIAVLAIIFSIAVAVVAVMVALLFCGFMLTGIGVGYFVTKGVAVGLGLMGGGLIVLALGVLAVWLVVWCFGWFVPWAVKGIVKLCKKPFEKKKEHEA